MIYCLMHLWLKSRFYSLCGWCTFTTCCKNDCVCSLLSFFTKVFNFFFVTSGLLPRFEFCDDNFIRLDDMERINGCYWEWKSDCCCAEVSMVGKRLIVMFKCRSAPFLSTVSKKQSCWKWLCVSTFVKQMCVLVTCILNICNCSTCFINDTKLTVRSDRWRSG